MPRLYFGVVLLPLVYLTSSQVHSCNVILICSSNLTPNCEIYNFYPPSSNLRSGSGSRSGSKVSKALKWKWCQNGPLPHHCTAQRQMWTIWSSASLRWRGWQGKRETSTRGTIGSCAWGRGGSS